MAVAMASRHRLNKMWAMKHLGSGHQYTPVMCAIHVDIGNGRDASNDVIPVYLGKDRVHEGVVCCR